MSDELDRRWSEMLSDLPRYDALSAERRAAIGELLRETELGDVEAAAELLAALAPVPDGRQQVLALFLQHSVQPWLVRDEASFLTPQAVARLVEWYRLPACEALLRFPILRTLAIDGYAPSLAALADLIASAPPADERQAVMALVPLFQPRGERLPGAAALFPRLLDAVADPRLAAAVLDLSNHLTRRGVLPSHPAKDRAGELASLLGGLAQRLSKIEESPQEFAASPHELSKIVNESVALAVSLCDALALAGDATVLGKLRQVSELAHRRVQTEAFAAMARLGENEGLDRLAEMAREPVVRSRALYYLEELNAAEKLAAEFRTPEARAEGDLAAWMAQPTRFGMAPDSIQLIDRVRQYWPGYVDPVDCFLLGYEYRRGDKRAAGVGIVGPTTAAAHVDLQDLPPADIYAFYAGLDAEHSDIYETPIDDLSPDQEQAWEHVRDELTAQGYDRIALALWGHFFGEQQAVAAAEREGRRGVLIVADDHGEWFPSPRTAIGLGPAEAYAIFKGRKLLKTFNSK